MDNRLFRTHENAMVGGVCAGLGKYLGIDFTWVRLFFVLLALGNGIGVLLYFLLWIIVPLEGQTRPTTFAENVRLGSQEIADRTRNIGEDLGTMVRKPSPQAGIFIGAALILLGCVYLLQNLHLPWLRWLDFNVIWPVLLIIGGIALLIRRAKGDE